MAKCYLTWDADFKWFDSTDMYIPVVSGGLLAISRQWWNETGGYDQHMRGWGGENLDQSLRAWLCGGEIVQAEKAHVAHMWRVASNPKTRAQYIVSGNSVSINRMRAAVAWYGEFSEKLAQFPFSRSGHGQWYGDISNILAVKTRQKCNSFAWFLHRFSGVYIDGGLIPSETYLLQVADGEQCLTYTGGAGTSPNGWGKAKLHRCNPKDDRQRWHGANKNLKHGGSCCSGIRAWNTDQCIYSIKNHAVQTYVCDIAGTNMQQQWSFDGGHIRRSSRFSSTCITPSDGKVSSGSCRSEGVWQRKHTRVPIETELYQKAVKEHPEWAA